MKKIFLSTFLLFFLGQCSKNEAIDLSNESDITKIFGNPILEKPFPGDYTFFKDALYGNKVQNKLDLLLPKSENLKGVVLYFHGGSFLFGSKEDLYQSPSKEFITALLESNVAVINAEYTFIDDPLSEGVFTALEEGSEVIRFTEENASLLRIPPQKIILAGVSAGAGIAQWNGFKSDNNSSIVGVLATIAQSSYDLYEWQTIFPEFSITALREEFRELDDLFIQFYNGEPTEEKRAKLDYRSFMDANDPPLYIYNPVYEETPFNSDGSIDFNILFHSVKHADYLRLKALEVGQEFSGAYKESPEEFVTRILSN